MTILGRALRKYAFLVLKCVISHNHLKTQVKLQTLPGTLENVVLSSGRPFLATLWRLEYQVFSSVA